MSTEPRTTKSKKAARTATRKKSTSTAKRKAASTQSSVEHTRPAPVLEVAHSEGDAALRLAVYEESEHGERLRIYRKSEHDEHAVPIDESEALWLTEQLAAALRDRPWDASERVEAERRSILFNVLPPSWFPTVASVVDFARSHRFGLLWEPVLKAAGRPFPESTEPKRSRARAAAYDLGDDLRTIAEVAASPGALWGEPEAIDNDDARADNARDLAALFQILLEELDSGEIDPDWQAELLDVVNAQTEPAPELPAERSAEAPDVPAHTSPRAGGREARSALAVRVDGPGSRDGMGRALGLFLLRSESFPTLGHMRDFASSGGMEVLWGVALRVTELASLSGIGAHEQHAARAVAGALGHDVEALTLAVLAGDATVRAVDAEPGTPGVDRARGLLLLTRALASELHADTRWLAVLLDLAERWLEPSPSAAA